MSRARLVRRTLIVALVVGIAYVTIVAAAWVFQRQLIYLPSSPPTLTAAEAIPGAREVELTTSDGLELSAWFVEPDTQGVVLIAPGNAGNRQHRAALAQELAANGLGVLLMDYRGYGGNPGSPTEFGLAQDARAAVEYLYAEAGVPHDQVVYFGESLGTGVVSELATEYPPAAMVLRSPFTSLADVGQHHYRFLPVRWLLKDRYPVAEHVTHPALESVPITVILGTRDSVVPTHFSRHVAEVAGANVVEIAGANHNDRSLNSGEDVVRAIVQASADVGINATQE
ncbi:alpha/beta hydrolase [Hoyosella rhizosphaerae]|nr:alpha/beta fold hydrolase [Hoyosella rhizosphaerae]MBN4925571.1 alpha/beta hydrolase [Hoyosella rhizosphaerae]